MKDFSLDHGGIRHRPGVLRTISLKELSPFKAARNYYHKEGVVSADCKRNKHTQCSMKKCICECEHKIF